MAGRPWHRLHIVYQLHAAHCYRSTFRPLVAYFQPAAQTKYVLFSLDLLYLQSAQGMAWLQIHTSDDGKLRRRRGVAFQILGLLHNNGYPDPSAAFMPLTVLSISFVPSSSFVRRGTILSESIGYDWMDRTDR